MVDYKTDQVRAGAETQAAQKYNAQLQIYARAAQQLYPAARVQPAIAFVRTGALVQLPAGKESD